MIRGRNQVGLLTEQRLEAGSQLPVSALFPLTRAKVRAPYQVQVSG